MKKTMIIVLALVLTLVMCACGSSHGSQGRPLPPDPTCAPIPIPTENPKNDNVFFNDSNNIYDAEQVTIRPRHMYWEGDTLVAQCFVINGKNVPVYDLNVEKLIFSNDFGTIADGAFGALENATINPYSHILWTFRFSGDAVQMIDGDLQSINCQFKVNYSH